MQLLITELGEVYVHFFLVHARNSATLLPLCARPVPLNMPGIYHPPDVQKRGPVPPSPRPIGDTRHEALERPQDRSWLGKRHALPGVSLLYAQNPLQSVPPGDLGEH